jgi:tetratricopeptide (TPR) repeat protein
VAKLFSGSVIDETGGQAFVSPEELTRIQKELVVHYPDIFTSSPTELRAWRESAGRSYVDAGNWAAAVACYDLLLRESPSSVFYLAQRGTAHAGLGHWKEASSDMLQAVDSGADDLSTWNAAAILCLWTKDLPRYQKLCADLLRRFGGIQDISRSNGLAYLCSLGPDSARDLPVTLTMVKRLIETRPQDSEIRNTYGAVLYRCGEIAEAIRQLEEAIRLDGNGGIISDWLFLSMASARTGRADQARRWLDRAEKKVKADREPVPGKPTPEWSYPLHDEILLIEARQLLAGQAPAP